MHSNAKQDDEVVFFYINLCYNPNNLMCLAIPGKILNIKNDLLTFLAGFCYNTGINLTAFSALPGRQFLLHGK